MGSTPIISTLKIQNVLIKLLGKKFLVMANLEKLLSNYEHCSLECDGLTRVIHYILNKEGIAHDVYLGAVIDAKTEEGFSPHFWIVLSDGRIIDYRARMWLGNKTHIANGIFKPEKFPLTRYEGEKINLSVSDTVYYALLMSC